MIHNLNKINREHPYYEIRLWDKENKDLIYFQTYEEALKEYKVLVRMFDGCNLELKKINREKIELIKKRILFGNTVDFITEDE